MHLELIFLCVVVMLLTLVIQYQFITKWPIRAEIISIQNISALFLAYSPAL